MGTVWKWVYPMSREQKKKVMRWSGKLAKKNPPESFHAVLYYRLCPTEVNDKLHALQMLGVDATDIEVRPLGLLISVEAG